MWSSGPTPWGRPARLHPGGHPRGQWPEAGLASGHPDAGGHLPLLQAPGTGARRSAQQHLFSETRHGLADIIRCARCAAGDGRPGAAPVGGRAREESGLGKVAVDPVTHLGLHRFGDGARDFVDR